MAEDSNDQTQPENASDAAAPAPDSVAALAPDEPAHEPALLAEPLEGPDVEMPEGAVAPPAAEPAEPVDATQPADDAAPADASEAPTDASETPTAVSLGLLPEVFVSTVSTQLHFYAPAFAALPPRPEPAAAADEGAPGSARRRNRRRSGAETRDDSSEQAPPAPRQRAVELITEPQRIKGSTRLEAKKQRRRDGREAGRRRTVVTEAEFLARREAVDRVMIVRSKNGRVQIAVLEDNVLVEHYVARNQDASLIGNVYLGRVQNVLPSMEAAFVDIGRGRNAVLYSGEVDWDAVETGNQPRRIELALTSGDRVLVQVTKDPVGHKGARLTSQISLPGRYLV